MSHSGRLLDANDKPIDGPTALAFELHTQPGPGGSDTNVWMDAFPNVIVAQGYYTVFLGDTSTAAGTGHTALTGDLFSGERYLAITVNGSALTPWLRIGAMPYALESAHAEDSATLGGKGLVDLDQRYALAVGGKVAGDGSGLTGLNATELTAGTVPVARLPADVALLDGSPTFTSTVTGAFTGSFTGSFTGDGSGLKFLNASALAGAIPLSALPPTVARTDQPPTFTGTVTMDALTVKGTAQGKFSGDGSSLTGLLASAVTGTLAVANLPAGVALTTGGATFAGPLAATTITSTGNITATSPGRFVGDGSGLTNLPSDSTKLSLTGGTLSGALSLGGKALTNVAAPVASTDAATKAYVDASASKQYYRQLFTASGTWTCPSGGATVVVTCVGGGGGGGSGGWGAGGNGGASAFGSLLNCQGGTGGSNGSASGTGQQAGGAAVYAGVGPGGQGYQGFGGGGGGAGNSSYWSAGGGSGYVSMGTFAVTSNVSVTVGAGGTASVSQPGGPGAVIVEWWQ